MDNFFPLLSNVFSWHSALCPVWFYLSSTSILFFFSSTSILYQTLSVVSPQQVCPLVGCRLWPYTLFPLFLFHLSRCVWIWSYIKVLIICIEFFFILVSHLHSWESKINREGEMEESWKGFLLHTKYSKNETDWRFKIRLEIWSSKSRFFFSIRPRMTQMIKNIFQGCLPILPSQGLPPIAHLLSVYYLPI